MKRYLLGLIYFATTAFCVAQNLVPNSDFEQYGGCPTNLSQIDSALFWTSPSVQGTPDYFNQCSGVVNVPNATWGYQQAHSGVAYCGISTWIIYPVYHNYREYVEVPLTTQLTANTCYNFEMYVNPANKCQYTTDDISVYFSDTVIAGLTNWFPLPFTPQINNTTGNITDTLGWTLISGLYLAHGGENYLIIGSFKDDSVLNVSFIDSSAQYEFVYFYLDDVSLVVSPCTGFDEQNERDNVAIYPSLFSDKLFIKVNQSAVYDFVLYDILSKKVLQKEFENSNSLTTEQLSKGMYIYEVRNKNRVVRKGKVLKE
jgi:hypothetical protein